VRSIKNEEGGVVVVVVVEDDEVDDDEWMSNFSSGACQEFDASERMESEGGDEEEDRMARGEDA
jgi:hypothetical protein